jgi:hypothetical protein
VSRCHTQQALWLLLCYDCAMRDPVDLLRQIREAEELATLLAGVFEFDVNRAVVEDSPRLTSGRPLEAVAGDFTGGVFFLCGTENSRRPVLYASSEGDAGVIAADLEQALALIVGFPYWRDCLKYSASGDLGAMESAADFLGRDLLANNPTIDADQSRVVEALQLPLESPATLVPRLRLAVKNAGPDFTFVDETGEYGGLFGSFPPSRNRSWR